MAQLAEIVFRDFETDGVPASGKWRPRKSEIRALLTGYETGLLAGSAGGVVFANKATMDANLSYTTNTMAWVIGDPVSGNDGIYQKTAAPGLGSWSRRGDLPYTFFRLSDVGAGTANAIQATSDKALPSATSAVLFVLNVFEANTGNVTLSINGAAAKPLLTNSGSQIAAAGITSGMFLTFIDTGSSYRLLSDQASSAIVAAAEAARDEAEAAAAAAIGAVPNVFALNVAAVKSLNPASATAVFLKDGGRAGQFLWNSTNLSSKLVKRTVTPASIDAGTDTFSMKAQITTTAISGRTWTAAGHGFANGDKVTVLDTLNARRDAFMPEKTYFIRAVSGNDFQISNDVARNGIAPRTISGGPYNVTVCPVHDLNTGDAVLASAAVNGLAANTKYYVIRIDRRQFKLATSLANARAGTAIDITGTTPVTFTHLSDPSEGFYIPITGAALDGSAGAYARVFDQSTRVNIEWFGVKGDGSDQSAEMTAALNAAAALGIEYLCGSPNSSYRFVEVKVPAGASFDIDFMGAKCFSDFNASTPNSTGNFLSAMNGRADLFFRVSGIDFDGEYDTSVSLTGARRWLEVKGYGSAKFHSSKLDNIGQGGSVVSQGGTQPDAILDRSLGHTCFTDNTFTRIADIVLGFNYAEGMIIQNSETNGKSGWGEFENIISVEQYGSGTPVNLFNLRGGKVSNCRIGNTNNSPMNILSENIEICFNEIFNVSNSTGIDLYEGGLFYSHNSYVHDNWVHGIDLVSGGGVGIRGCGNGLRIENNIVEDCIYEIAIQNNIGTSYPLYGTWLTPAATPIGGMHVVYASYAGSNRQGSGVNTGVLLAGADAVNRISVDIECCDNAYPATKTEIGISFENVDVLRVNGRLMTGRDQLIKMVGGTNKLVDLTGLTFNPESGQGVDCIACIGGTLDRLVWGVGTSREGTLDANFYDIARRSAGTFSEVCIESLAIPTDNLPANTRKLKNGKMYVAGAKTITGSLAANGGRLSDTFPVPGFRTGIDEVLRVENVSSNSHIVRAYDGGSDNTVSITYQNGTAAIVTDPSANLRIIAGPKGQAV